MLLLAALKYWICATNLLTYSWVVFGDLCAFKFSWLNPIKIIKHKSALLLYQYSCFILTDECSLKSMSRRPFEIKWQHILCWCNLKPNPLTTDRFLISLQACSRLNSCCVSNFVQEFGCRTFCWLTKKPYCPWTSWVSKCQNCFVLGSFSL